MAVNRTLAAAAGLFVFIFLAAVSDIAGQDKPLFAEYKGVTIGMTMADARQKLGKGKEETDTEDYWEFDNEESVRVLYSPEKIVRAISINYNANEAGAPTALSVFGKELEAKADGSKYKLVHYNKAGFWISYVRTAGENALVIVTLQKIDRR
jgi:ABC-type microcin C transport system permease subunit YejE